MKDILRARLDNQTELKLIQQIRTQSFGPITRSNLFFLLAIFWLPLKSSSGTRLGSHNGCEETASKKDSTSVGAGMLLEGWINKKIKEVYP
ncbi:hypothetical protein KY284_030909 [Solanum tuberosum]|nr:hypothetical protein KY284_030909 [Solanum tuberosum]